ncbi:hypothetical protein [Hymenobacter sp. 15J16-1T3B]|uniref:hypothetical protein n=1 Tax=Hymenobacter sp. 15J16-1T3B TaxID=2886941 RepID=UPI001D1270A2|nr:hypothetical protein [Hymenobacter sp. 15J16-1T3B]
MLSVVIDYEEKEPIIFFGMDDAEVQIENGGGVNVVFEDYHTGRTIQVGLGPYLVDQIIRLRTAGELGCHYIEQPPTPPTGDTPF